MEMDNEEAKQRSTEEQDVVMGGPQDTITKKPAGELNSHHSVATPTNAPTNENTHTHK